MKIAYLFLVGLLNLGLGYGVALWLKRQAIGESTGADTPDAATAEASDEVAAGTSDGKSPAVESAETSTAQAEPGGDGDPQEATQSADGATSEQDVDARTEGPSPAERDDEQGGGEEANEQAKQEDTAEAPSENAASEQLASEDEAAAPTSDQDLAGRDDQAVQAQEEARVTSEEEAKQEVEPGAEAASENDGNDETSGDDKAAAIRSEQKLDSAADEVVQETDDKQAVGEEKDSPKPESEPAAREQEPSLAAETAVAPASGREEGAEPSDSGVDSSVVADDKEVQAEDVKQASEQAGKELAGVGDAVPADDDVQAIDVEAEQQQEQGQRAEATSQSEANDESDNHDKDAGLLSDTDLDLLGENTDQSENEQVVAEGDERAEERAEEVAVRQDEANAETDDADAGLLSGEDLDLLGGSADQPEDANQLVADPAEPAQLKDQQETSAQSEANDKLDDHDKEPGLLSDEDLDLLGETPENSNVVTETGDQAKQETEHRAEAEGVEPSAEENQPEDPSNAEVALEELLGRLSDATKHFEEVREALDSDGAQADIGERQASINGAAQELLQQVNAAVDACVSVEGSAAAADLLEECWADINDEAIALVTVDSAGDEEQVRSTLGRVCEWLEEACRRASESIDKHVVA